MSALGNVGTRRQGQQVSKLNNRAGQKNEEMRGGPVTKQQGDAKVAIAIGVSACRRRHRGGPAMGNS
jgi:hypothetical protein